MRIKILGLLLGLWLVLAGVGRAATLCSLYAHKLPQETQIFFLADGPFSWEIEKIEGEVYLKLRGITGFLPHLQGELKKLSAEIYLDQSVLEIHFLGRRKLRKIKRISPYQIIMTFSEGCP